MLHPIKRYAKENKIKINTLAKRAGFSPVYVYQVIMGYRAMSGRLACSLFKATNGGLSLEELNPSIPNHEKEQGREGHQQPPKNANGTR
jgi:DNA-binding transcriptional regulator YdaS (Cro superfamily)